ncbi:MAG: GTPase Era [Synergistaceae bacterium]|jgi:GTP-binding protein Era|nr:GTPase Era [Synergistaceae bacterium]
MGAALAAKKMTGQDRPYRAGLAALVGLPNAGKSSIVNALLREHAAAVSSKPQTTRNAVRCVLTTGEYQMILIDTPGTHRPRYELGRFMTEEIDRAFESADAVCFVVETGYEPARALDEIYPRLEKAGVPIVLAINKIDRLRGKDEEIFWKFLEPIQERIKPAAVVPVSALDGTNLDVLALELSRLLPEGEAIYPEDVLMDATERFLAAEIIRERIFETTEREVPHSVAVVVEEFKSPDEYPELRRIEARANIIVERPGQKGILIGSEGTKLKSITAEARREMERRFGYPVSLSLWVKVNPQWTKSTVGIRNAGYRRA